MGVSPQPNNEQQDTRANHYTVLSSFEPIESLLEIKRSEFIGHLKRVTSEDQARAYIETIRKQYHDARHVCSAFIVGADRNIQRSSDDGEPAGTAGIPMLQALLARSIPTNFPGESNIETNLSDVCAVVVRYFGGIKLGAGGLVRAYTDAVVQVVDQAQLITRQRLRVGTVAVAFGDAGKFENELRNQHFSILGTEYSSTHANIQLGVFDDADSLAEAEASVAALSAGLATISWGSTKWVDLD